jgi:hypothetical protein
MTTTPINKQISEDEFYETYKPVKNPFEADAPWDGAMLETYGRELEHVEKVLKTAPDTVWTVLDVDGALIASSGFHHINRIGYIITEVPVAAGECVETIDEDAAEDDEGGE